MATIRTVAVHDVVSAVYPREVSEPDRVAMAIGKAIDSTLNHLSHVARMQRAPGAAALRAFGTAALDEALSEEALDLPSPQREVVLEQQRGVAEAFRRSGLLGLPRPRSRLILIGEIFGVYAQPDYWDGRSRFYEMKSYRAIPPHPDVALQLRLFHLAYPGFEGHLVAIDRHARPVTLTTAVIAPPTEAETGGALRAAVRVAEAIGEARVLEYIDVPVVRYPLPAAESGSPS